MPNTVLGKVSVVPRGDYNASTTYYALDIVGYNGGSYLAMKESTGVTPSNDQTNWMQLSGPGLPGVDGVTFTPSVSEAGEISWTNDGGEDNPDPVNIMGPQGNPGAAAGFGEATATVDETTGTPSVEVETSGPDTAKVFSFAFSGLKGETGEKGDPGDQGIQGIPGVAAGFGTPTATVDDNVGTPGVTVQASGPDTAKVFSFAFVNLKGETGAQGIQGEKGDPGTSVQSIQRTSGTGAAGTTDTYTMYDSNDDAIGTFTVYNGSNGTGSGDFMANGTVPMTGALNMGGQRVTNVGAPTGPTDAVRQSDLEAISDEIDHILDGTTPVTVPVATEIKAGIVKPGEGMSVTEDGTLNVDDQLPAGGQTGQVLTKTESGEAWQDAPDGLPEGGETGQVLTRTSTGAQWDDIPSDLPAGGTDGQILTKTADGVAWENPPDTGVTTFNGRKGEVSPGADDYSADMIKFTDGQTFQDKYDSGQLTGPAGADGAPGAAGPQGEPGKNATINGVNALTIQSGTTVSVNMSGGVATFEFDGDAADVPFTPGSTGMTATNVQAAITELFTSASEGKALVAAAVTGKGVQTAADASYEQIAANVTAIETGGATATLTVSYAGNSDTTCIFVNADGSLIQSQDGTNTGQHTIPIPSLVLAKTKSLSGPEINGDAEGVLGFTDPIRESIYALILVTGNASITY